MLNLQTKMWLLVVLLFAILYGIIVGIGNWMGVGNAFSYLIWALILTGFQYLIGPSLVSMMMKVRWVSEKEEPELHQMVAELAQEAKIPKPKVGISQINLPNAFAFGRSLSDGRVCVTEGIRRILSKEELRAVIGHEISHLKHRDMQVITMLSVIPLICYWIGWRLMWGRIGNRRERDYTVLIGLGAMLAYFITNLLVLAGSRIREYYADERSVKLGNPPHHLATALYKLVYSCAQARRDPRVNEELKRVEGGKAFFLNDISRAENEIEELKEIDQNFSGTIEKNELLALRTKKIKLTTTERLMELFATHPNMLNRIKRLSTLV